MLGAHTRVRRTFTAEDIGFLHTIANTLALPIERNEAEQDLRGRNREIAELAERVAKLADGRRRILADALDVEDRTRERISQLLHDEVLQSLLTTRQDLAKAAAGTANDEVIARAKEGVVAAISELRNAVVALYPVTLGQGGLLSAIKATADFHARRSGFEPCVNVARDTAGIHDQLIVSLAQELLNNVVQHADANRVTLSLRRVKGELLFEFADDGRGMDTARARAALDQGHVGLASIALRVESLGGRFELVTNRGEGTRVRAIIPAESPRDPRDGSSATPRRTTP